MFSIDEQKVMDRKVIEQLISIGDQLNKEREICFWFYFKSSKQRKNFKSYIVKNGFTYVDTNDDLKEEYPYGLVVSKLMSIGLHNMIFITDIYGNKALECDGYYDGWETPVVYKDDDRKDLS